MFRAIIENTPLYTALISIMVSVITFFLTNYIKNYFENNLLKRKLETEHKFNQQKKIKEVLSKYKIHMLTACEDFNYRMWNFYSNYPQKWMNISEKDNDYGSIHYYFHSFVYRFLSILAWIKKINKEIIFVDTTLASKNDLEFIKFIRCISQLFCNLTAIERERADGTYAIDHFFRDNLNTFPDAIITENGIKSYSEYVKELILLQQPLSELYQFFDSISPTENRKRYDRLYFLHLIVMAFLNNYGYDYQKTGKRKLKQILNHPLKDVNIRGFFEFLNSYKLVKNKEVRNLIRTYGTK
ncbi:MAG: hypothetical protein LBG96_09095 [Tannerella sp.]|jgi:hypothetical protein|nr:hypothetical protein [Tannerella sp.]